MSLARRLFIRALAVLLALTGVLVASARPMWACSCAQAPSPDIALQQAQAVFTGTVTTIVDRSGFKFIDQILRVFGQPPQALGGDSRLVTLAVADSWKGVTETPVTVATGAGDADCGFGFSVGGQYLVYAHANNGALGTNICQRTADLSQAPADLAYLQTQPTLTVTPKTSTLPLWCLAGTALLAIAATAGWAWRRRRAASKV